MNCPPVERANSADAWLVKQIELSHGLGRDVDLRSGNCLVVVVNAINNEVVVTWSLTAD